MRTSSTRAKLHVTTVAAMVLALAPRTGRAHAVDLIEHMLGATNVHAVAGAGGMTVGVSRDGDLTVLTWPSPSYADQLSYVTSNDEEARSLPRFGASEGMGGFVGVVYSTDGGSTLEVSWLRDEAWSRSIGYASEGSSIIVLTADREDLALTVTQTDLVDETEDVWMRLVEVSRGAASPVTDAWALLYLNASPTVSRVPEVPMADWALEPRNDFVALWDAQTDAIVHFHPGDTGVVRSIADLVAVLPKRYGPIGEALAEGTPGAATVEALAGALDDDYAEGAYLAIGTWPDADGFQVGFDETDLCGPLDTMASNLETIEERYPDNDLGAAAIYAGALRCAGEGEPGQQIRGHEGWLALAEDALEDASDGELSGARVAAGHVNEALRVPLDFAPDGGEDHAAAAFYVAAGATAGAARTALDTVRALEPAALVAATRAAHEAWLAPLRLPVAEGADAEVEAFAARTLLNIRVGTDRWTKAIVASISRQPPYGEDWPRDGAFFNAALDVAGLTDLVTERLRLYASLQRDEPVEPSPFIDTPGPGTPEDPDDERYPADAWEMNYYADGMAGGNIRFEIDNTALLVWSFVAHSGAIEGESARQAYLEEVYPTVRRAADLLTRWRDPWTYLPFPANEDDNPAFTQGLQGAVTVFGALRNAAMAARALSETADAERWERRAAEVRWAIENHLWDEETGFVELATNNPGSAYPGASSWLAWPARVWDPSDPRVEDQLSENLEECFAYLGGDRPGAAYLTKTALAVALLHPDAAERDRARDLALLMVHDVADPETHFLGEVFVAVDDDGDGATDGFDNRVATPHLWAATLTYLTLMAHERPDLFDRHEALLPAAQIPDEVEPPPDRPEDGGLDGGAEDGSPRFGVGGGGCSCRAAGPGGPRGLSFPGLPRAAFGGRWGGLR